MSDVMIRRGKRIGYTVIRNSILRDANLSLRAIGLFAVMLSLPDDWQFSESGLAALLHTTRYSIHCAVAELSGAGYLIREQEHGEDGKFSSVVYTLEDVLADDEEPPCEGNSTTDEPLSENQATAEPLCENQTTAEPLIEIPLTENRTTATYYNKQNKDLTIPPLPPVGEKRVKKDFDPESFEKFWAFYPSWGGSGKGNKQKARAAWNRVKPDKALRQVMADCLRRMMLTEAWRRGVGIPHASTWLNGRRWEDPLPEQRGTTAVQGRGAEIAPVIYGHEIGGGGGCDT